MAGPPGMKAVCSDVNHPESALTLKYAERLLKFLLWQKGGCKVSTGGRAR